MTTEFLVKGFRDQGAVTTFSLVASTSIEARDRAEADGISVIRVSRPISKTLQLGGGNRVALSPAHFTSELLSLLRAGLTLPEAMSALRTRRRSPEATQIIERTYKSLSEGRTFSKALVESNAGFSDLYIATVRSSEQTGNLVEALTRYLDYDRKLNEVRATLISASLYPAILVLAGLGVVSFLLGYVIPRFSRLYADLGEGKIPAASRVLMHLGVFVDHHRPQIGVAILLIAIAMAIGLGRRSVRESIAQHILAIPVLGERVRLYSLARLSHTLSMLLRGGIPFVPALDMTGNVLRTAALRSSLAAARQAISQGQPVAETFLKFSLATEIGARLLAAGERTGNMPEMTDHVARFYDDELALWLQRFTRLFEPLLMTAIGVTIGIIVMLMYMPIFGLASSLG